MVQRILLHWVSPVLKLHVVQYVIVHNSKIEFKQVHIHVSHCHVYSLL